MADLKVVVGAVNNCAGRYTVVESQSQLPWSGPPAVLSSDLSPISTRPENYIQTRPTYRFLQAGEEEREPDQNSSRLTVAQLLTPNHTRLSDKSAYFFCRYDSHDYGNHINYHNQEIKQDEAIFLNPAWNLATEFLPG